MTRRQLAKLAAAGAAFVPQQAVPAETYTGALDGFRDKVNSADFDPVVFSRALHAAAPMRLAFRATNRREAEAWQKKLRPKIAELIAGVPAQRGPLTPQTLEIREFPGY